MGSTPVPMRMDPMTSAVPEADDVQAGPRCEEEGEEAPCSFDVKNDGRVDSRV